MMVCIQIPNHFLLVQTTIPHMIGSGEAHLCHRSSGL